MQVNFNRQLNAIFDAGPKDIAKMTRGLEGVNLGIKGVISHFFGWLNNQYTPQRLEEAYNKFFTERKVEIGSLKETKNADPKANERYAMLQSRLRSSAAHLGEADRRDRLKGRISEELPGRNVLSYSGGIEPPPQRGRFNSAEAENQPSKAKRKVWFNDEVNVCVFPLDRVTEKDRRFSIVFKG